ncbi:MAG: hypothetical protein ACE5OS_11505 [Anaerolineae bacterium]
MLGTVGAWHRRAPHYSLRHLEALVRGFAPDILCAEVNRADWEAGRLGTFPPEYRECLVPLCRELGVIVVPVGNRWRGPPSPLRLALLLGAGPRWVNSAPADRWHRAWARLCSRSEQANRELVLHVLEAVQRDPGRRLLVTVQVERRYAVIDWLRQVDEVTLAPGQDQKADE